MKYLRKIYDNFYYDMNELIDEIKPQIGDILLPLIDNKLYNRITKSVDDNFACLSVHLKHKYDNNRTRWIDIKDEVLHLISYMNSTPIKFSRLDMCYSPSSTHYFYDIEEISAESRGLSYGINDKATIYKIELIFMTKR